MAEKVTVDESDLKRACLAYRKFGDSLTFNDLQAVMCESPVDGVRVLPVRERRVVGVTSTGGRILDICCSCQGGHRLDLAVDMNGKPVDVNLGLVRRLNM
jgi:hypothetical protein